MTTPIKESDLAGFTEISESDLAAPVPNMVREPKSTRGTGASDESVGIGRGPEVNTAPNLARIIGSPGEVFPVEETEARRKKATMAMGATLPMLAAPAVGAPLRAAMGGGLAASMAAGAAEGATAGLGVEGGSKVGAAVGAALPLLSPLLKFATSRAFGRAESVGKAIGRAGSEGEQKAIADSLPEVTDVVHRYGIGKINKPQVASEAIKDGITRAEADLARTRESLFATDAKSPLYKDVSEQVAKLEKDVATLGKLQPVVDKMATADRLKASFAERFAANPVSGTKEIALGAVKAPVQAAALPFKAADIALAKLFGARQAGQAITPQMLSEATTAGVSPAMLQRFAGAQQ